MQAWNLKSITTNEGASLRISSGRLFMASALSAHLALPTGSVCLGGRGGGHVVSSPRHRIASDEAHPGALGVGYTLHRVGAPSCVWREIGTPRSYIARHRAIGVAQLRHTRLALRHAAAARQRRGAVARLHRHRLCKKKREAEKECEKECEKRQMG